MTADEARQLFYRITARSGRPPRAAELVVAWYANRPTSAQRPMEEETRAVFDGLGLTGPFWRTA